MRLNLSIPDKTPTDSLARKARHARRRAMARARLYDALAQCDDRELIVAVRYGHARNVAQHAWHYREVA